MSCTLKNREKIISQYLMRELSEADALAFQEHMFGCDACYEDVTFKRKALRLFHETGEEMLEAIELEPEPEPAWGRIIRKRFVQFRPLIVTAAAVLIVTVLGIQIAQFLEKPEEPQWYSDGKAPYEYRPGERFRSADARAFEGAVDSLAVHLQREIERSMGAYQAPDYPLMLQNMARLEATAAQLRGQLSEGDTVAAMVLRDYEFYYGVSRLARARTQRADLPQQQRERLLQEAVGNLSGAMDLATAYGISDTDRESYFLGIAYGFSGQIPRAVDAMEAVADTTNPQFDARASLLRIWKDMINR